jgi:hypothetical protein
MKKTDYPCWLSPKDLHIAKALVEKAEFIYCGKDEDFIPYDEELGTGYKLAKCCGWQLASAYGDVALEAVRDGAVFGKCLEILPDINFKKEVRLAKRVIKEAAKNWEESNPSEFEQLSLL